MKRRLSIVVLAVVVLLVSAVGGSRPEPKYSFRIRPSANGIELECESGCAWKTLSAKCQEAPCEFRVDEFGLN
jgi:hypothetical protein